MRKEGQVRIPSGCAIAGIFDKSGARMNGEAIIESIAIMHDRSNGLGGGFAAYGIYPEYKDYYAFHLFYDSTAARKECEDFLDRHFDMINLSKIPTRKLKATDRLIGPARLCLEHDVIPAFICLGAAAAVRAHLEGSGQAQTRQNAQRVLQEVSGLTEQEPLMGMILGLYEKVAAGATVGELRRAADRLQVETRGPIA